MSPAVEEKVTPRPLDIGLLGSQAVVPDADLAAKLAEEGTGIGICRVCHFHYFAGHGKDNAIQ